MPRLLFEKKGNAVWISHLDLMRLFQRAFKRAGLALTHTHGFNPRPSVSIALPLSVGVESCCELLEFSLDDQSCSNEEICDRLNPVLVDGIRVLEVYDGGRKYGELSLLSCKITMHYEQGAPNGAEEAIRSLLSRTSLILPKKTKSGIQDQDIIPMIIEFSVNTTSRTNIEICALICCQNPTLNPAQIPLAISTYAPEFYPDSCQYERCEIYDAKRVIFR